MTRSNLVGVGIVCGLEIKLDNSGTAAILLSKGCGVTAQGYLIIEPEDVPLVSYREKYTLPSDPDYSPFYLLPTDPSIPKDATDKKVQYPLWELFPDGEPNTTSLSSPAGFLNDKAVLLFLELKRKGLRNCSPNNCDDKGAEVTASVKRLLIRRDDLKKIVTAANALGSGLTSSDLENALLAQLNLPDLRLMRFDVLNSGLTTSNDVFGAFLKAFQAGKLVAATGAALNAAYAAFQPLLQEAYPTNPFGDFNAAFGFLDNAPLTTAQVRFLQYYVDLFDDLLRAYDEFRWKGAELICACCPPDKLFPRHLMLGLLHPETVSQPGIYRQGFLPSPAIRDCDGHTKNLLQLFARLVEMTKCFTNAPGLPNADDKAPTDPQIRITPGTLGDKPLSGKAIPYYYRQNGTPPIYRLWSVEKTRRNRANQNLSYRYDEYSPAAPAFVSNPLRYDLEPHNFLRIEGHLGKSFQRVMGTLILLKSDYRLPIEVIALRTGAYDDTQPVDLTKESARFQDLDVLYDTLREELLSSLAEGVMFLYDVSIVPAPPTTLPGGSPKFSLLKSHAPNYLFSENTVGAWFENYLTKLQLKPYIDVDQNKIDVNAFAMAYCTLFQGTIAPPDSYYPHIVSIYYIMKLAEIMPAALDALAYADFENRYQDLIGLVRYCRSEAIKKASPDLASFMPKEELIDHFDQVLFSCKLEAVRAVHLEYLRRLSELKKKQFLANFLKLHPGIQHKAGVPLGGTFIIVYHDDPGPVKAAPGTRNAIFTNVAALRGALGAKLSVAEGADIAPETSTPAQPQTAVAREAGSIKSAAATTAPLRVSNIQIQALTDAIGRIKTDQALALNPDVSFLIKSFTGAVPISVNLPLLGLTDQASKIIAKTVDELANGTVIADFYLPYLISSDYVAVQFALPTPPLGFSAEVGCPDADGNAPVAVKAKGGVAPYEVSVDKAAYQPLDGSVALKTGVHSLTVRDAQGIESSAQSVTVAAPITFGAPAFNCNADSTVYTATVLISGGTPPYTVNGKAIETNSYTSDPVTSGKAVSIAVVDSHQCTGKLEATHTCVPPCDLPCAGIALRRGFRFWLPDSDANKPFKSFKPEKQVFVFDSLDGKPLDLSTEVAAITQKIALADLNGDFKKAVGQWLAQINKLVADKTGKASWLTLNYEPAQAGRLGTLWIEYFECLKFDIQFISTFQRADTTEQLRLSYTPDGTTIQTADPKDGIVKVPPFDGIRTDKCNPKTPVETLCAKAPSISLKITKKLDGLTASLSVTASDGEQPVSYLWEVQDGKPAMSNAQNFTTTITSSDPLSKSVSVTGFTKQGCRVTAIDQIDLPKPPPKPPAPPVPPAPPAPPKPPAG